MPATRSNRRPRPCASSGSRARWKPASSPSTSWATRTATPLPPAARSPATSSRAAPTSPGASPPCGKKGIDFVNQNPQEARKYLAKNTLTPENVVDTVPMVRYFMAGELTDKHKAEFQKFIDFSTAVGTLPEKVDITKYLQAY